MTVEFLLLAGTLLPGGGPITSRPGCSSCSPAPAPIVSPAPVPITSAPIYYEKESLWDKLKHRAHAHKVDPCDPCAKKPSLWDRLSHKLKRSHDDYYPAFHVTPAPLAPAPEKIALPKEGKKEVEKKEGDKEKKPDEETDARPLDVGPVTPRGGNVPF